MKKIVVWMLVGVLVLGMVYALADKGTVTAQAPAGPQALLMGDSGEEVTRLQNRLTELYYFGGEADGIFKESTRDAVREFQSDFGMDVNGIADPKTQSALYNAEYHPFEKGDSGEGVKALQNRLSELGFYDGKISGNYLDGSYYAISDFQRKNGLDVTGKADVKTQELLYDTGRALSKAATAPVLTPTPAVTLTLPPAKTPAPAGFNTPAAGDAAQSPIPENVAYTKKLQKGSKGDNVTLLQAKLFELGYYMDEITGTYTSETKEAVIAFQQTNGLPADGITGEKTWNMVFNNQETLEAGATPRPTPVPTPVPYAITIDVNNQVVTAYGLDENNQYTKIVRQMICSTGTYETPSSIGSWKLGSGRSRFPLFPKFNVYVQYWTPIANGMGFHSVIYNTKNTMDLSVSTYSHLGRRASHGCIRLQVADAKWIYENAGKGTVVTVTNKLPSDPELTQSLKPAPLNWKNMLPKTTPAPTAPPVYDGSQQPPQPFRTLGKGDKGADVYWLQMKLKEMGYYMGTVTGGYYGGTQKAVKAYQKDYGLTSDGVAGTKTQKTLYADVLPASAPEVTPAP